MEDERGLWHRHGWLAYLAVLFPGTSLPVWQVLAIAVIRLAVAAEASWERLLCGRAAGRAS